MKSKKMKKSLAIEAKPQQQGFNTMTDEELVKYFNEVFENCHESQIDSFFQYKDA